ncbi:unnamed protein product [Acanthoscelides obtectus]|uniref:Uncharacterized protein n=1 Tax=Acanthoscelides obtectus TaxID=200917 RepID=A0A9P0PLV0_ACAOB|nr:unnamed protein product [Acanthoscelides obtectus]CAK1684008.1 hypothetical protein AOBTE_LOCUS34581 [Acanthoscelides obtectus]
MEIRKSKLVFASHKIQTASNKTNTWKFIILNWGENKRDRKQNDERYSVHLTPAFLLREECCITISYLVVLTGVLEQLSLEWLAKTLTLLCTVLHIPNPMTPCLDAQYTGYIGHVSKPKMEAVLTITGSSEDDLCFGKSYQLHLGCLKI